MSFRKQLIRDGIGSIAVRIVGTGLSFLLAVVLARTLGSEGYGTYSFALSLLFFLSIPLQAGFPNLVVRETARAHLQNDWSIIKGLWLWVVRHILIYCFILGALFILLKFADIYWLSSERDEVFSVGLVLIPCTVLLVIQSALIRGLGRVVIGIIPDGIIRPGLTLLAITLSLLWLSSEQITPRYAMTAYVASLTIAFMISVAIIWAVTPPAMRDMRQRRFDVVNWRRAVYPLTVVGGLQLMYSYSDVIILGLFRSDAEVGGYRAAGQLGMLVIFGLSAINQMLHPHFSKIYANGDMEKLQKLVTASSLGIFLLALLPGSILIFAGEFALKLAFGEAYIGGALALAILSLGQLVNATFGSVGALLNMTGHETDAMRGMLYSLVVNLILAFLLIPPFGIEGAALATAISLIVWNVILRFYVQKRLKIESIGFLYIFRKV